MTAACFVAAAVISGSVEADSSRFPAHFTPSEIRSDWRNAFYEAFTGNRPLDIERGKGDAPGTDALLRDVWIGNDPDLKGSLDKIELLFELPGETPGTVKDSFKLDVIFRLEDFEPVTVVRSSRASIPGSEGGWLMFFTGNRTRRVLARGFNQASAVAATPEMEGNAVKGALICPVDVAQRSEKDIQSGVAPFLGPTGFKPVSARLGVKASVNGKLLSGLRPGLARANIATSNEIPNEKLHFDETFSRDPLVEVDYQGEDMTQPIAFSSDGKLLQGLSLQLELQNNAGYVRSTTITETLEIAPVDRDFEFTLTALKRRFTVASRNCYSVLRTSEQRQEYSKSNLRAP